MLTKLKFYFFAARPKTLTAAISPVLVGAAFAFRTLESAFPFGIFLLIIFSALSIQVLTNYVNDLWDYKKGSDTSKRQGPTRYVQAGLISEKEMLGACYFALGMAVISGFLLVLQGGLVILLIGLLSIAGAYAYTAGPYPLAHNGLGEPFVLIFFGPVAVLGTQYLLGGEVSMQSFLYGLALGSIASALLVVNNARDIEEDRQTGKKTLAARFGYGFAIIEFWISLMMPYVLIYLADFYFSVTGGFTVVYIYLTLPFAVMLASRLGTIKKASFNSLLPQVGAFLFIFAIVLSTEIVLG